jgi:carboxypeptidase A2
MKKFIALLLAILSIALAFTDTRQSFDGYQVLRCKVTSDEQIIKLRVLENEAKIDIWAILDGKVDIMISPKYKTMFQHEFLNMYKVDCEIFINNVAEKIQEEFVSNIIARLYNDWHKKYHTYDEIVQWLKEMNQKYPKYTKIVNLGETTEKRPIVGIEISKPNGLQKKVMVYNGGMHAREWIGPASMMYLIEKLLNDIGKNNTMDTYLEKIDFRIIPVVNADGYTFTHTNNRMWRKTRSGPINGCYGADPNRNFDYKWATTGSSSNPCSETFHGKSAASEPEVQALKKYIQFTDGLHTYVDWHSYSQLILRPWGATRTAPPDEHIMKPVSEAIANAMQSVNKNKYKAGRTADILYAVGGGSNDWVYATFGAQGYAAELQDTGRYGFILPPDRIIPQGEEVYAGVLVMTKMAYEEQ